MYKVVNDSDEMAKMPDGHRVIMVRDSFPGDSVFLTRLKFVRCNYLWYREYDDGSTSALDWFSEDIKNEGLMVLNMEDSIDIEA